MQLHQLQTSYKNKSKKRVGRGGKKGTYSGRGVKGQKSRAGRKLQPAIREVFKRYHKLRGYRQILKPKALVAISLGTLEKVFEDGSVINPAVLTQKRIIRKIRGKVPAVKIVAGGSGGKKLVFQNCDFSQKAKEMIEKAGGVIRPKIKTFIPISSQGSQKSKLQGKTKSISP